MSDDHWHITQNCSEALLKFSATVVCDKRIVNEADLEESARDVNRFSRLRKVRVTFTEDDRYPAFGHTLVDAQPKP
jgi:hypothetical protein